MDRQMNVWKTNRWMADSVHKTSQPRNQQKTMSTSRKTDTIIARHERVN